MIMPKVFENRISYGPYLYLINKSFLEIDEDYLQLASLFLSYYFGNIIQISKWREQWIIKGLTLYYVIRVYEHLEGKYYSKALFPIYKLVLNWENRVMCTNKNDDFCFLTLMLPNLFGQVSESYSYYNIGQYKGMFFFQNLENLLNRENMKELLIKIISKFNVVNLDNNEKISHIKIMEFTVNFIKGKFNKEESLAIRKKIDWYKWWLTKGSFDYGFNDSSVFISQIIDLSKKYANFYIKNDLNGLIDVEKKLLSFPKNFLSFFIHVLLKNMPLNNYIKLVLYLESKFDLYNKSKNPISIMYYYSLDFLRNGPDKFDPAFQNLMLKKFLILFNLCGEQIRIFSCFIDFIKYVDLKFAQKVYHKSKYIFGKKVNSTAYKIAYGIPIAIKKEIITFD